MNDMQKLRAGILALLILSAAVGCGTQLSPGDILTGQVYMQLAVGTLNDSAGTLSTIEGGPGAGTYLNAVSSFRNNLGASAFANPGSAYLHVPGAPAVALGGLYSYGQPTFFDTSLATPACVAPNGIIGLPPAYVPANSAGCGYSTGFLYSAAPPTPGSYSISTVVTNNNQNQKFGVAATLPAGAFVLPAYGSAPTYAPNTGTGGGLLTVAPPAGVTETLIVICSAACNGTNEVATALTHSGTAVLPAGTLAAGSYQAFAVGADYQLFEAGPPASAATQPTLTGAHGTADLTVSGSGPITQT
jgi:hypothetical protein